MKWPMKPINELCLYAIDCVNKTAPTVEYETPYKMIRNTNIGGGFVDTKDVRYVTEDVFRKWTRRLKPKVGDVILSREAPVGAVGQIGDSDNIFLGQRLFLYRPDPQKLDANYLTSVLQSHQIQGRLRGISFGSTVDHIKVGDAERLLIPVPSIEIQQKIGDILSVYNVLIKNNDQRIQLLEEAAWLLFREWFVYFRFLGHEKVKIIDGMPEGWKKEKINKLVTFKRGVEPGSDNYLETYESGSFPFFRVSDLVTRNPDIFVDEQYAKSALLKKSDIVISLDGSVGIVSMGLEGCYSTGIRKLIIKDKKINRVCLYFLMKSHYVQGVINAYAKGTTIQHAGDAIKHMNLILPPQNLMDLFDEIASPALNEILILLEQNQKLSQVRDLLLPRLMSGAIEV